jgi:hypothetical protein
MHLHRHKANAAVIFAAMALLIFAAANRVFAQSLSGFTYNGQVYTSYQANEYLETPQGPNGTAAIRATGASYGSVVATQYVQTYTSNTIAPETASSPGFDNTKDPLSPTDSAVVAAIHNMQAQGITVFLKPHVDSLDGVFRGTLAPSSVADWFASYQTFILHYAQLASENNVGGLVIGTELASLTTATYKNYWLNIIAQIRSSYPNLTLAYGANATYADDEFTTVSFWDKVDIMGVDGYFPLTNHADPTVAELVAAWSNNKDGLNIVSALHNVQSKYNKPLIFTELGYVSAQGTNETPYANAAAGAAYDPTEQKDCYEAFFEVFSQQTSWMKGVFWWAWNVSPPGTADTGYTPQSKPAADITLVKWYCSTTPGFTLAPSTSLLTFAQGLQVPATIAVTNLGGFNGNVLLTATGLPAGVTASFTPGTGTRTQVMTLTASSAAAAGLATITITGTSGSLMATTTILLTIQGATAQTITFAAPQAQAVGTPLTLTATASSGLAVTFTSATPTVCTVSGNTATFLQAGTCTIDANQSGDASYSAAPQVQQSFTVNAAPSFTLAPTSSTVSVAPGSSITDTISVSGAGGFLGSVSLSAAVTSTPQGAQDLPTLSFGATSPVTVTSAGGTATLTLSTTAATTAMLARPAHRSIFWELSGSGTLACVLLFGVPARRRRWPMLLGMLAILFTLTSGVIGCGGGGSSSQPTGNPGTTPGNYTITVTATSSTTIATLPVTVTVQ